MVLYAKYSEEGEQQYNIDKYLRRILDRVKRRMYENNDDFLMFCTGLTNSGKSHLGLNAQKYFTGEVDVNQIGMDQAEFAMSLKRADKKGLGSWVCMDEANISKYSTGSKFNKDTLDLYYSIRGKSFFHWWNNPSIDVLQKEFIKDILKGCIFIFEKHTDGTPRRYMYFTKKSLLNFLDKHGKLSNDLLLKYGRNDCNFVGWFREFPSGSELDKYLEKKDKRMSYKINNFVDKYAEELGEDGVVFGFSKNGLAHAVGVAEGTVYRYLKALDNELVEGEHYTDRTSHRKFSIKAVALLKEYKANNLRRRDKALNYNKEDM